MLAKKDFMEAMGRSKKKLMLQKNQQHGSKKGCNS